MKRLAYFLIFFGCASSAHAEFTGDVKLACEAILCLSSGSAPSQCQPSLSRYFGIKMDEMSDTITARLNFLNLCPTASYDGNMKSLVKAIAHGAGRCDAATLNAAQAYEVTIFERATTSYNKTSRKFMTTWTPVDNCYGDDSSCRQTTKIIIGNSTPSYCSTYSSHGYTFQVGATYVGTPLNGGRWQ